jgi:Fur family transcriptional regulator, ferric uptake regulator
MYCEKCQKVIEFQSEEVDALIRQVGRDNGFHANSHTFIVRGTCSECNRARVMKRRLDLV